MIEKNIESLIRFVGDINPKSCKRISEIFGLLKDKGIQKVHLILSTPGGSVTDGLFLYSFLTSQDIELVTYNAGHVDSIGTIIFCAGKERYTVPYGRFLIHPIQISFRNNEKLILPQLEEITECIKNDYNAMAEILSENTKLKKQEILEYIKTSKILDVNEAKKNGLVDVISNIPKELDSLVQFTVAGEGYESLISGCTYRVWGE